MKIKLRLFKHTFMILSILCCLLLGSTSIIYALTGSSSNGKASQTSAPVTASEPSVSTASASVQPEQTGKSGNSAGESSGEAPGNQPSEPTVQNDASDSKTGPEQTAPPVSITISAVGDIMAHQGNLNNAYSPKTGKYDFTGFLEYVKPYLEKSDLTIANLETVTAGPATGYTTYPSFNTPDAILTALSGAGFDLLSTANNHSLDRGISGLTRTIEKITQNKMINVGSSTNGKNKYITKDINGIKVSILSYSAFYNGNDKKLTAAQKATYLSPLNEAQIRKDINAVKAAGSDAVIVFLHWGTEYQREPAASQTALSKKILSWGADIILGSHPHVIQKSEITKVDGKDKFVIYSMGNFISGYRRIDKSDRPNKIYTEDGVIVNLQIEKDSKGTILKNVDYVPTWVDKYYVNNRPVFKIIPIPTPDISGSYVTDYNRPFIKQSYKNTMSIMSKMK